MTIERPEPRVDSDEVTMLREFLDHYRATVRLQASGLTDDQLGRSLAPSDLTLGGMLKHLAFVEDFWFSHTLTGNEPAEPWRSADWERDPDWDWHSAGEQTHAELDALLAHAIAESDRFASPGVRPLRSPGRHTKGGTPTTIRMTLRAVGGPRTRTCSSLESWLTHAPPHPRSRAGSPWATSRPCWRRAAPRAAT